MHHPPHSFRSSTHQLQYTIQKQRSVGGSGGGSLSQNDSFDSTSSGNHQSSLLSPPSFLVGGVPAGGRDASLLHRSHSDAQDGQHARRRYQQAKQSLLLSSVGGSGTEGGVAVGVSGGSGGSVDRHQQLQKHYLDRVRKMRRRPSNSFRPFSSMAMGSNGPAGGWGDIRGWSSNAYLSGIKVREGGWRMWGQKTTPMP